MEVSDSGDGELVVLCAANNFDDVRLSDRPLAEALVEQRPVLYVDPPLSHLTPRHHPRLAAALDGPRLRREGPRLWRLTPVVTPWPYRTPVVPLTRRLARRHLARALRRLDGEGLRSAAVISTWLDVDVFDLAPRAAHAYWVQDDVAAGAALWGLDPARLVAAERRVAASADVVLVANPVTVADWERGGHRAVALPNGCDPTRFDDAAAGTAGTAGTAATAGRGPGPPPALAALAQTSPGPVAGFVGHLNARTDLDLLHAVLDRGLRLVLVGPVEQGLGAPLRALLERPGVLAVGPQPFEDLPAWFAGIDVGLVPYRNDEFNRVSFPLKTLEYLVAGLPVVSTALPASRWLDCPDVALADVPAEFAEAAARAAGLSDGGREDGCENGAASVVDVARRREFARAHSWRARASDLLEELTRDGR